MISEPGSISAPCYPGGTGMLNSPAQVLQNQGSSFRAGIKGISLHMYIAVTTWFSATFTKKWLSHCTQRWPSRCCQTATPVGHGTINRWLYFGFCSPTSGMLYAPYLLCTVNIKLSLVQTVTPQLQLYLFTDANKN